MKYGTSGFRDHHIKIFEIAEKVGTAIALLACYRSKSFGIMITASHNHYEDNGVKIMDEDGHMVSSDIERYLENYVNSNVEHDDNEEIVIHNDLKIIIGYDSRSSGPSICSRIVNGIKRVHKEFPHEVMEHVTTPQLHFRFSNFKTDYKIYAKQLAYKLHFPCVIDCANGIGSKVMRYINHRSLYLINTEIEKPECLNVECSSDYVCTHETFPKTPKYLTDLSFLRASLDGDADRVVFYYGDRHNIHILNGDYIAALILTYLSKKIVSKKDIIIGFIYTGYTNSACIEYVKNLLFPKNVTVRFVCTATGVKHLHKEAEKYDIGIYFEQNGHGNVLFNHDLEELNTIEKYFHPNIGDGILDLLAVLYILQDLHMSAQEWYSLYYPYPSILEKQKVQDKNFFECTSNELRLIEPDGLQHYIDAICKKNENYRAFVRASGTENCVRIYVEGPMDCINLEIYDSIVRYINKHINNLLFQAKGQMFSFRIIDKYDIDLEYFELLGQLTCVDLDKLDTNKTNAFYNQLSNNHRVFVIEDSGRDKIIASGTLLIEPKLIRNYGKVGHIEDIVVSEKMRGFGLGKKMIYYLSDYAKSEGCYKCILDCSDENVGFYEKCSYVRKGSQMSLYF